MIIIECALIFIIVILAGASWLVLKERSRADESFIEWESSQGEVDDLMRENRLLKSPPSRPAIPVQMHAPMDPEAFTRALQTLRDDDHRWRAIMQILDGEIAAAIDTTCLRKIAEHHGSMAHSAGGQLALLELRDKLIAERDAAMRIDRNENGKS